MSHAARSSVASGRSHRVAAGLPPRADLPLECTLGPVSDDDQTWIGFVPLMFGGAVVTSELTFLRMIVLLGFWVNGLLGAVCEVCTC
jgi:hypothetical protein